MNNKAVIIIDLLNDFVTGDLKSDRAKRIIPKLKKLIEAARKHNIPVIYSNDAIIRKMLKSSKNGENTPLKAQKEQK